MLFSYRKFPESADENIFTVLERSFHQLEKGVDDLGRLRFGENVFGEKFFHDVGFAESHGFAPEI